MTGRLRKMPQTVGLLRLPGAHELSVPRRGAGSQSATFMVVSDFQFSRLTWLLRSPKVWKIIPFALICALLSCCSLYIAYSQWTRLIEESLTRRQCLGWSHLLRSWSDWSGERDRYWCVGPHSSVGEEPLR